MEITQIVFFSAALGFCVKSWPDKYSYLSKLREDEWKMFFYLTYTQLVIIGPQDVWRTSPPTSRRRSLKILFDRLGDVLIWGPGDVLIWRPWDVLIWCSRDVPGRSIQDVPRTFSGRSIEDSNLEYSNFDVPAFFFLTFLPELFRLTKSI